MINTLLRRILLISLAAMFFSSARAELTLQITKDSSAAVPIAVVPFGWHGGTNQIPTKLSSVIQADLSRSGLFKTLAERDMLTKPTAAEKVKFRNWEVLGQEYLLIGQVDKVANQYRVQFQLFDVYKAERLLGYQLMVENNELRRTAHHISDLVYEKLTGRPGVFSTRIAYITTTKLSAKKRLYKLLVADADGFQPKSIASSKEPIMSPAWTPDGKKIAYVSFETKRPAIYIQTLATGKRIKIPSYRGINGAPDFSPDGTQLALTLSKDGSPDIYVYNLKNRHLTRVTKSYALDTEPTWSPDGKAIVFTSNRGGRPQLYKISSLGGQSTRLTFEGDYNAGGQFSSDGNSIAMVHANNGDYRIAVLDLVTGSLNVLTAGKNDESPSFSANSDMVLYASKQGKQSVLSAVSVDGRMQQDFTFDSGNVREPAWSK